jgi:hypothetical protein
LHGTGQLFKDGQTIAGTWEFGRLTSCSSGSCVDNDNDNDDAVAATPTPMRIGQLTKTPTFQSVVRQQTALELALVKIFESPYHESLSPQSKAKHLERGNFDLASLMNQQLISLDSSIAVSSF